MSGQKLPKKVHFANFWKPVACGQTVLPDRSLLIGQKLVENTKIEKTHVTFCCQKSVTRQVKLNRAKNDENCQNSKTKMRQFWVIFKHYEIHFLGLKKPTFLALYMKFTIEVFKVPRLY